MRNFSILAAGFGLFSLFGFSPSQANERPLPAITMPDGSPAPDDAHSKRILALFAKYPHLSRKYGELLDSGKQLEGPGGKLAIIRQEPVAPETTPSFRFVLIPAPGSRDNANASGKAYPSEYRSKPEQPDSTIETMVDYMMSEALRMARSGAYGRKPAPRYIQTETVSEPKAASAYDGEVGQN
jgi:hypothetical protein